MARKKVGLALGGGSARGLAHIGVLEVLEQENIPIDMIAGTSIGALIGAVYARTHDISQMKKLAIEAGAKRFNFFMELSLPKSGLIRGRRVEELLKQIIGNTEFGDMPIPFSCVAVNIDTGQEVVMNTGPVWQAVRASLSIPVLFNLIEREGRYLADGGLVNPVPVSVVKDMGADIIIAVNAIPDIASKEAIAQTELKEPNLINVISKMIYIFNYRFAASSMNGADVIIEPAVEHIGFYDYHYAEEGILQGQLAAQDSIHKLREILTML